jgi:hypothetical protein
MPLATRDCPLGTLLVCSSSRLAFSTVVAALVCMAVTDHLDGVATHTNTGGKACKEEYHVSTRMIPRCLPSQRTVVQQCADAAQFPSIFEWSLLNATVSEWSLTQFARLRLLIATRCVLAYLVDHFQRTYCCMYHMFIRTVQGMH